MRYGLVIAPATLPDMRPAPGTLDSDLLRERLPQPDLGFEVTLIDPASDVAEQLEQFFEKRKPTQGQMLFYASTLVATAPDGEVFLCLDPTNPDVGDSLRDVATILREGHTGAILFVLESRHVADEDDPFLAATVAGAIRKTLSTAAAGAEVIVAVQPAPEDMMDGSSPFTRALIQEMDDAEPGKRLTAERVYERIQRAGTLVGAVPCFAHARGTEPFALVPGDETAPPSDVMPAAETPSAPVSIEAPTAAESPAAIVPSAEAAPPPEPAAAPPEIRPVAPAASAAEPAPQEPQKPLSTLGAPGRLSGALRPKPIETRATDDRTATAEEASAPARAASERPPAAPEPTPSEKPAAATADTRPSERPPAAIEPTAREPERGAPKPPLADPLPRVIVSERPPPAPSAPPPAAPSQTAERPASQAPAADTQAAASASAAPEPAEEIDPIAQHMKVGERLAETDPEGALAEYKKALLLVSNAAKETRADIYVAVGRVKLTQDKRREAISNFEKATQLVPLHRPALEAIATLSAEERDFRSVASAEERILSTITDPAEQYERLLAFADRWANVAFDTARALGALTRARQLRPEDLGLLGKIVALHEASGDKAAARALRIEITERSPDSREKAERLEALGRELLTDQHDEDGALAFFERALDADPEHLSPLATAATILAERQEWSELEAAYRRMLKRTDRIADAGARSTVRWELRRRLGMLFRDHLEDPDAALHAFENAISERPAEVATRQIAATLARDLGKWDAARTHLQAIARIDPMVVQTYHDLFDVFQKARRPDQAFAAASVTAQLGHADQREKFIYEEGRSDGPTKPQNALDAEAWELLRVETRDANVEAVLEAIAPAAIEAKIAEMKAAGRLAALDPATRHDPKQSTVSIVRSFKWASHWLGVPMPAVYVRDDTPVGLAAVIAEEPSVIAGSGVLRGKSLVDLAFTAGRHLAYHMGAHRLLLYYPVIDDLAACFLAGVSLAMPSAPVPAKVEKTVAAVRSRIEKQMGAAQRAALERAVLAFEAGGSRADLQRWVGDVERCATRAGYLLCGDLRAAATSLAAETSGVLTLEDKMTDLLSFTVSEALYELRLSLGIAIEP